MQRVFMLFCVIIGMFILGGCMSASQHATDVNKGVEDSDRLTVGTVQREIHKGMTGADVAEVLGSPNIVSTDEQGREVWIYDKISTSRIYSRDEGSVWVLIGVVGGERGAESTSQRTLTIIIKFDEHKKVRDFAYHASRF